ncbi:MAG: hypothetical protein LPK02_07195 [Rhodobacterales bacterium]|nr:hypothetical protein [Rhodobacterales bacterium]
MDCTTSRPGKMSGDRVHFTLKDRHLRREAYQLLLEEVFGIKPGTYDPIRDLKIICRPSQFARFIILRFNKYGEQNDMAGLDMKLVAPPKAENVIDCSRNPNRVEGDA